MSVTAEEIQEDDEQTEYRIEFICNSVPAHTDWMTSEQKAKRREMLLAGCEDVWKVEVVER